MSDNPSIIPRWEIIHGDALKLLGGFSPGSFDAVITDPPYASGGRTQAEKNKSTAKKYSGMGDNAPPPFDGDSKDQRSWTRWCAVWLSDARRILDPFADSGSTVLAAVLEGYSANGIEVTEVYAEKARERIAQELAEQAA